MGFWRTKGLVKVCWACSVFRPRKLLLKPVVLQHLRKKKLLWLLNGGSPKHRLTATALFSPTPIKPMKYQHFWLPKQAFAYKTNAIYSKLVTQQMFLKKCIKKWISDLFLEADHTNFFSSIRISSPEPLNHTVFEENL